MAFPWGFIFGRFTVRVCHIFKYWSDPMECSIQPHYFRSWLPHLRMEQFHLSLHENILTIALINIQYFYINMLIIHQQYKYGHLFITNLSQCARFIPDNSSKYIRWYKEYLVSVLKLPCWILDSLTIIVQNANLRLPKPSKYHNILYSVHHYILLDSSEPNMAKY
jgi:hypothetical protein